MQCRSGRNRDMLRRWCCCADRAGGVCPRRRVLFFRGSAMVHAKFVYSVDRENNKLAIALHDEVAKRIGDRLGATFGGKILIGELLE
jgi:hypothetical protein